MVQLCRNFRLIPEEVELFSARQLDAFEARLRERLAVVDPAND
jgi:hypothetical protein